jgi:nicotinamide-nucleotide amidase
MVPPVGAPPDIVDKAGPVSEEVTVEMALGAKRKFGSDVAVAVTCAAGPDAQNGAEPGTTVLAVAGADGAVVVRTLRAPGDRAQVRQFATTFALTLLRAQLR